MKYILLILTLLLAGCNSNRPEGEFMGTMSVYRTPNGTITIVNDKDGNSMAFDFRLHGVMIKKAQEKKGNE